MTNEFKYQTTWKKEYEKSNWAMPVYPVIADTQFKSDLQIGDTVKRRYRSNPIFAKSLSSSGGYSVQNYTEAEESYTISKQKEASVRIVKTEVLHTDQDVTRSYGVQLANAIWQEIEGDTLHAAYAGAGSTLDAGNFGGTAGQGVTPSVNNIADIPVLAMENFLGKNVVFNNNKRFGKLPYEDYDGMLTWIIPPQVWTVIQKYMVARNTSVGDRATVNGYKGEFGDFQVFVANTLPFTTRLALSVNPTDGDTITIKGVTLTFKSTVDAGTTDGQVKIASTAALTVTNLVTFLNSSLEADVADATNVGYNGFGTASTVSEGGFTIRKSDALHGISATDGTTYLDITMKGTGKVTVSSSFTSASNGFAVSGVSEGKQCVHSLFVIAKNVCLAIRKEPEIYENFVSEAVAKDYVMWTVYDNKVFRDQARAIIDLAVNCAASSFTAYSNVHA
jgi:hypothetical protein